MSDLIQIDAGVSNLDIQDTAGNSVPADGLPANFRGVLIVSVFNNDFVTSVPAGTTKWSVSLSTLFDIDEGFESDTFELIRKKYGAGAVQAWLIPKVDLDPRTAIDLKVPIKCISTGQSVVICNVINIHIDLVSNYNLDDKKAILDVSCN